MSTRVGINGFGRIGRNLLRAAHEADSELEFVAVNDVADAASLAHLLKYDSIYGRFPGEVELRDDAIIVDGNEIKVLAERDPADASLGRARGRRRDRVDGAVQNPRRRRQAPRGRGAKKVIITAPAKRPGRDRGPRRQLRCTTYDPDAHHIISNASCTTNCLAPVAKVDPRGTRDRARADDHDPRVYRRPEPPGHAAQGPAPGPGGGGQPDPDLDRRGEGGRAGAAGAEGQAQRDRGARPGDRLARLSTSPASSRETTSAEEINSAVARLRPAAACGASLPTPRTRSSPRDIVKDPHSSIFDAEQTMVIDGRMLKILCLVRQRVGLLEPPASSWRRRCSSRPRSLERSARRQRSRPPGLAGPLGLSRRSSTGGGTARLGPGTRSRRLRRRSSTHCASGFPRPSSRPPGTRSASRRGRWATPKSATSTSERERWSSRIWCESTRRSPTAASSGTRSCSRRANAPARARAGVYT